MKLDYMQCWNEAVSLLAEHKEAILAVAGVFVFLPTLLFAQFVDQPILVGDEEPEAFIAIYSQYFNENALAIISSNLILSFGGLVMYFIVAPSRSTALAEDMGAAAKVFIFFLIANVMTGFATLGGMLLFIVPGLYIACRLILVPMFFADTEQKSPVEVLKLSWNATKDNGFSILFFISIIAIVGVITMGMLQVMIGIVTGLATGGTGWPLLENIVAALTSTAFQILLTVIIGALYIQFTGSKAKVEDIFT